MKKNDNNMGHYLMIIVLSIACLQQPVSAQTPNQRTVSNVNTTTRITYHNGRVMPGTADLYLIFYGCWDETCMAGNTTTKTVVEDFAMSVGGSPYFQINAMYPNDLGQHPSGGVIFGGEVLDRYSRGTTLTATDIQGIVADQIDSNGLPQDPTGVYVVIASADVSSPTTGFCVPSALPHHGTGTTQGIPFEYAFLGNPMQCPSVAAPQFFDKSGAQLPTPNGTLAGDAMVSTMAELLSETVTDPTGTGWYDRYGLENGAKCEGQFGPTYSTSNGARANIRWTQRDYLIQQNWVNSDRKAHCAMNSSL